MTTLAIAWLLAPFLAAFLTALWPGAGRPLALLCALATVAMAGVAWGGTLPLQLLGPLGVSLQIDALAAPFLLLNGLVAAAVVLEGARRPNPGPFLVVLLVLQVGLNSAIVAVDLISIYVALEVVGIGAFLLLGLGGDERAIWLALRYGLVSNTVMLLFLIGVALVYQEQASFALAGAGRSSGIALALMAVALTSKAELFVVGLWLPRTNAEAPLEVSALLSGAVVSAGVVPLLRLALAAPVLVPVLQGLGLACAALGIVYALMETDLRRLLAWSTLSQMGLVVLAPAAGGLYAVAHGLAKSLLFLGTRHVGGRSLAAWRRTPLPTSARWPLLAGSLSIAGVPPLLGFAAKEQLGAALTGPLAGALNVLAVGTVAVYARLWGAPGETPEHPSGPHPTGGLGVGLLMAALLLLNLAPGARSLWGDWADGSLAWALLKAGMTVALGVGLAALLDRVRSLGWRPWNLPQPEHLDALLGATVVLGAALVLVLGP